MNFIKSITPKGWLIIAVVVIILILLIFWASSGKKTTNTTTTTVVNPPVYQDSMNTNSIGDSFPLHQGSRGENVKKWQTYLNTKGAGLTIDGIWGPLTEAASKKYTSFNNITLEYFNSVVK